MRINEEEESDEMLMLAVQEGRHASFMLLVRRYTDRAYRLAYRFISRRDAAEDIAQDVFCRLWENPHTWNPAAQTKFSSWFYRIVVNRAIDYQRRHRHLVHDDSAIEGVLDPGLTPEEGLQHSQEMALVERAMRLLPVHYQTALNLAYYEGLDNMTAAAVMNLSLKAFQSLLMRAKGALKEQVEQLTTGKVSRGRS